MANPPANPPSNPAQPRKAGKTGGAPRPRSRKTTARAAAGAAGASAAGAAAADRRAMIAEAAYYRAERRGFAPGNEQGDWLAAELEIDATLAASRTSRRPPE